jgi:flagellar L-ring protein precursor FlgH
MPALFLVLTVSGCATAKPEKAAAPPIIPPKQFSSAPSTPYPEPGPQPASLAPTGSLWAPSDGSLFADLKAAKIGDVVTITVSEQSNASKAAATIASRDKQFSGQFNFGGVGINGAAQKGAVSLGPYDGKFSNSFNGTGQTTKTDSMTAYMTATVVDVLPNGNMVIRGSRWTKVNDEMQQMILEGIVRPADITRSNTVLSQNVAEAKIFLVGKGPVTQHQKPGWLGQIIDFVSPF